MRVSHIGLLLRVLGLVLGLLAITALAFGVDPVQLSPFLVKVAIYKLAFISAVALLVAGAMIGRKARVRGPRS